MQQMTQKRGMHKARDGCYLHKSQGRKESTPLGSERDQVTMGADLCEALYLMILTDPAAAAGQKEKVLLKSFCKINPELTSL